MPPSAIDPTRADHETWARLWSLARDVWSTTSELARRLGLGRSTVAEYCTGARHGDWHVLIHALRQTARAHPDQVPALVSALASELLDAEGHWIPAEAERRAVVAEELVDVQVALGELGSAARAGLSDDELEALGQRLVREAVEAARVVRRR